ncbi:hypothetical protein ARMGADRAFT_1029523 [Armillaria gallica]|uniref:Uncharacterized protein n=1 Tax=Armillaria gallica TaxID=47427 RepID=A0A2H3DJZ8_ARMGA|nr:hypothetical protein ARMGADRAFT_1029523 [Armillaria gallica]
MKTLSPKKLRVTSLVDDDDNLSPTKGSTSSVPPFTPTPGSRQITRKLFMDDEASEDDGEDDREEDDGEEDGEDVESHSEKASAMGSNDQSESDEAESVLPAAQLSAGYHADHKHSDDDAGGVSGAADVSFADDNAADALPKGDNTSDDEVGNDDEALSANSIARHHNTLTIIRVVLQHPILRDLGVFKNAPKHRYAELLPYCTEDGMVSVVGFDMCLANFTTDAIKHVICGFLHTIHDVFANPARCGANMFTIPPKF